MPRLQWILYLILLSAPALATAQTTSLPFRLFLSEVRPGAMATEQRCVLVFPDRRFHREVADGHRGREIARRVYEGEFSEAEWNELTGILERKEFRELRVPRGFDSFVVQDSHVYTISVAREGDFQNMEFLTDKSRKPYDSQLKPLLEWWKSFNHRHMDESHAAPNSQCSPGKNVLFSQ